jgi:hypothetical protein
MIAINDNNLWDNFEVSNDIQLIAKVISKITSDTHKQVVIQKRTITRCKRIS